MGSKNSPSCMDRASSESRDLPIIGVMSANNNSFGGGGGVEMLGCEEIATEEVMCWTKV
jgi:hypothetical protein